MKNVHERKKIAFVINMYYPVNMTGSEVIVDNLARAFNGSGNDVSVITSRALDKRYYYFPFFFHHSNNKFEVINGIKVYRLECNHVKSFFSYILRRFKFILPNSIFDKVNIISRGPYLIGLQKLMEKEKYDVVFSSPLPYYFNKQVVSVISKIKDNPLFIFKPAYHHLLREDDNPEFKHIFDMADFIHVWCDSEKKQIINKYKIKDKKIRIIKNALIPGKLRVDAKEKEKFIRKYKLEGKKIILFAGVKSKYKGSLFLLKTINNLYKKDKSYLLIALGKNTLMWNFRKRMVNPNCVLDLGYVSRDEKELIFDLCDLYCMPSISETLGLSYLEAWYRKKPVIAADSEVGREIIGSAKGGLLVKFEDCKGLENGIESLIKNRKLANQLGVNGYRALVNNYMFDKGFSKYLKLFNGELNN